ncbi:MAG: PKD domain-containing protein [Bacteroidales bacterium]|nr:PKD domain-containing protein [Bacteroidales bacterium]
MNSTNSFLIGGYGNSSGTSPNSNFYLDGQIAEIVAFNTVNDSLRYSVNEYLVNKYFPDQNTQVSLGLDIHIPYGFCDTTITTAYNPDFISYQWSTGETDSVIHVNSSGRYTVTVTNSFGVTSTDDINVYFPEHFQMQDTTICTGDTIRWNLKMHQDDYSFMWYRDGEQLANASNQIEISEAGAYTCLITDTLGCSFQIDTLHLTIDNYTISAGFGNSDTTLCYGNRLHIASGYDETASAIWNDGTTDLEHYLTQSGTYTVTTTNARGCTATNSIDVTIQGQVPTPNFTTEGHCQYAEVTTTNLSTSEVGEISLYRWFANDSLIGTTENISHSFDEYGTQSLKLYLETSDHCFNDTTIPIYIYPQPKPDFSPKHFCQNALTEINARTTIAEGNIINHLWNLGDGDITGESITNTFESYGIKTITLTAESEQRCIGTKDIEVNVLQAEMPATEISGVCLGYETTFINKTPFNNINPQTAWEWNFGDDTETSSNKNTTHTYDTTGTYNVSLTVSFANHCTTTTDTTITIHELPEAIITTNDGCVGTETTLEAEVISVDNITTYKWQIDSIFESREQRPTFISDTTGIFAVTLDVQTEFSCPAQATDSITIHNKPNVSFSQSRDWGGNPLFVEFENTSESATSYHWNFGGAGESNLTNPYFIFTEPGTYEVSLTGTNEFGCTGRYTSPAITVVEPIVDIMLMDLKATEENGFAKISLIIVNLGTLPVEDLVLELKINNQIYRETIGHIAQGAVVPHTFGTMIPIPNSTSIANTICVEALVPDSEGHSETNLANNTLCITDAENLSVGIPYPIPAYEQITCDIYTKIPTDLDISIFSIFGKLVKHETISQHKGYLKYVVNVTDLSGGMYFIRVNSKDESITHKFEIR